jgi:hypothetical protein
MMKISGSHMKYKRILYIVLFSFLLISWNDNDKIEAFINVIETKSAQELFDEYYSQFINKAIKIEYENIVIKDNQKTVVSTGSIFCDKKRLVVRKEQSIYIDDRNQFIISGDDDNDIVVTHKQSGFKMGLLLDPLWLQDMYGPVIDGEQHVIRYRRPQN